MPAPSAGVYEEFVGRSDLRKALLSHLIRNPATPSELATLEQKHVSHVSRALAEMRQRGLVEYARSGSRERYYKATGQGYMVFAALKYAR